MAFVSGELSFYSEFCSAKFPACSAFLASLFGVFSGIARLIQRGWPACSASFLGLSLCRRQSASL
ncbi:unnamed protein product [Arabidopsis halleri]